MKGKKTALIHDWLIHPGGAEKLLHCIQEIFPGKVHALLHDPKTSPTWLNVHTSFLQKLPKSTLYYPYLLPFFPLAIEGFDLREYNLILSSSHAVAKGVLTTGKQLHICYCHTPMRYAWDLYFDYLEPLGFCKKMMAQRALHRIRLWDVSSSSRVDHFLANSQHVARRIQKTYGREATVIYPPVDTSCFTLKKKEEFYLTVSRLVPYKKIDLLVEAFSHMLDKRLLVVGDGPEKQKIQNKATKNIEFLGHVDDETVHHLMSSAKGFLFAAKEDFGLAPVESMASGTPVIAFGEGGALETIVDGVTGVFFNEQTVFSICQAIQKFETLYDQFVPETIQAHAQKFCKERFQREYQAFVEEAWSAFQR